MGGVGLCVFLLNNPNLLSNLDFSVLNVCLSLESSCHFSRRPVLPSHCILKFFLKLLLICYKLGKQTAELLELDVSRGKKALSMGLRDSPMNKPFKGLTHLLVHLFPVSQHPHCSSSLHSWPHQSIPRKATRVIS